MRQLEMLDEAGRLHIVGMAQHEFLVLRRCAGFLAELARTQRAVDQCHGHGICARSGRRRRHSRA